MSLLELEIHTSSASSSSSSFTARSCTGMLPSRRRISSSKEGGGDNTVLHHVHVAGGGLGELTVLVVQDSLAVTLGVALLVVHDIAQQGGGFDVAALPAQVLCGGHCVAGGSALVRHRRRWDFEGEGVNGWRDAFRVGMVALGVSAAAYVEVDAETHQLAIVGGYHLVDAVTEQEAPVHGGDPRFVHRHVIAVQIYSVHCVYLCFKKFSPRGIP
jgi:hypothetical protein